MENHTKQPDVTNDSESDSGSDSGSTHEMSKASLENLKERIDDKRWAAARVAYAKGYKAPEKFFPVIIEPGTFLSSPEKLQELAELQSTPETFTTTIAKGFCSPNEAVREEGQEVTICKINARQYIRLLDKSEFEKLLVWFEGGERFALQVLGEKETQTKGLGEEIPPRRSLWGKFCSLALKVFKQNGEKGR